MIEGCYPDTALRTDYGWAEITPVGPVVAGSTGTWSIIYHVGRRGVDDGGVIKVAWRDVSDWESPQFTDAAAPAYSAVATTGPASLRPVFEKQRYIRPWRRCVTVDVFDDFLREGDTLTLTIGDTTGGSPGVRAQTYCQDSFMFRVAVDWCGTWVYTEVPSPSVPIVSGGPHRLVVVVPSVAEPGEPLWVGIRAEDIWGNVCSDYVGEVQIVSVGIEGLPATCRFDPRDRGAKRIEGARCSAPGLCCVEAVDRENGLRAESSPLRGIASVGTHRPYWGDLHGQSEETVGTNSVSSYFHFARDAAFVDFVGHQGNDFQITKETWQKIRTAANAIDEPGRFTALLGYEWSANTPLGGDRNVLFRGSDGPLHRSSHVLIPDRSDEATDCMHVTDLFQALDHRQALVMPHVGGRYADLRFHDPTLEPVIEVYSEWGEFEWFLREALSRGHRVGFTANSDDHKGRPGAAHPGCGSFGVYGGLTCLYARELSREGLWEALKARRCYGTTGQRILLEFAADGHPMGTELKTDRPPELNVRAVGTSDIERIDLFRGLEPIYAVPQAVQRFPDRVRVRWSGQRIRARSRLVRWDGSLTVDSGRIIEAAGYAFDSPVEGIVDVTDRSVSWESVTTGDTDGVILTLDCPPEAGFDFATEVLRHRFCLRDLGRGAIEVDAGGVDMAVTFELLPKAIGREVSFDFREDDLPAGCHPYWVRLLQSDGAKAWSSPIYVVIP